LRQSTREINGLVHLLETIPVNEWTMENSSQISVGLDGKTIAIISGKLREHAPIVQVYIDELIVYNVSYLIGLGLTGRFLKIFGKVCKAIASKEARDAQNAVKELINSATGSSVKPK